MSDVMSFSLLWVDLIQDEQEMSWEISLVFLVMFYSLLCPVGVSIMAS